MGGEQQEQWEEHHARYAEGARTKSWQEAVVANQAFHFTIYRASQNPILVRLIENLWLLAGPFVAQQFHHSVREPSDIHPHRMLIDALRRRSPAEVGDLLVRDLKEGSNMIITQFRQPAPPKRRRVAQTAA